MVHGQRMLSRDLDAAFDDLLPQLPEELRARLVSAKAPHANAWMTPSPVADQPRWAISNLKDDAENFLKQMTARKKGVKKPKTGRNAPKTGTQHPETTEPWWTRAAKNREDLVRLALAANQHLPQSRSTVV
jgi:hypothetical protein